MRYGWSCEYDLWVTARSAVEDRAWFSLPYVIGYEHTVPERSGVYMITLLAAEMLGGEGFWKRMQGPIYIGQSENLRRRFKEHVLNRSTVGAYLKNLPKLQYCYCNVEKDQLDDVESQLVQVFGPRINRVQPAVLRASLKSPIRV